MRLSLACVALVACRLDFSPPEGAIISCTAAGECPDGYECAPALQRCVKVDTARADTPPAIEKARVSPEAAGAGATVLASFTPTRALGLPPRVYLDLPAKPELTPVAAEDGFRYTFSFPTSAVSEGTWSVVADLVDEGGNAAVKVAIGSVRVDFSTPKIVGSISATPVVVAKDQTVTLRVAVDEALAMPPQLELVWGAERRAVSSVEQADATTYVFSYTAQNDEPQGAANVSLTLTDRAGNVGVDARPAVLSFDTIGPRPIASLASLRLLPAMTNVLSAVSRVRDGTTVELFVAFDEPVAGEPIAVPVPSMTTFGGAPIVFDVSVAAGTTYVMQLTMPADYPTVANEAHTLRVTATDAAGNKESSDLSLAFVVDTQAPAAADESRIVQRREPWGSASALGVAGTYVTGTSGAIESCADTVCPRARIFDANGNLVASAAANTSGGFTLKVAESDYARLFVAVADSAGNTSGAPLRIENGEWLASFASAGASQDHRLSLGSAAPYGIDPSLHDLEGVVDASALADVGGASMSTQGEPVWRLFDTPAAQQELPQVRYGAGVVYDSRRDRVIAVHGMRRIGNSENSFDDFSYYDRTGWHVVDQTGSTHPAGRGYPAMAYDPNRDRVVLFGGAQIGDSNNEIYGDTWEHDGTSWNQRCDGSPTIDACGTGPSPRHSAAAAYYPPLRRVVIAGGSAGGDEAWTFDGRAWTLLPAATPLPSFSGASLAYHAATDQLVLTGGTLGADTWIYSAGDWQHPTLALQPTNVTAMTYDPLREVLVAFGDDHTYEWNGSEWTSFAIAASARTYFFQGSAVFDARLGEVLALFGGTNPNAPSPSTRAMHVWKNGAFEQAATTVMRTGAIDTTDLLLAFDGGSGMMLAVSSAGTTWLRDPYGWARCSTCTVAPTYVAGAKLVEDPVRGRVLLWSANANRELFEWGAHASCSSGTRCWELRANAATVPAPPTARTYPQMAFDSRRDRLLLYGGNGSGAQQDLWQFSRNPSCPAGRCWQQIAATNTPGPRWMGAMGYDPRTDEVLLVSGDSTTALSNGFGGFTDSWVWKNNTWTADASAPPSRLRAGMVFDALTGCFVRYGGFFNGGIGSASAFFADFQQRCAGEWSTAYPRAVPSRSGTRAESLAFDPRAGAMMHAVPEGIFSLSSLQRELPAAFVEIDWRTAAVPDTALEGSTLRWAADAEGAVATLPPSARHGVVLSRWETDVWVPIAEQHAASAAVVATEISGVDFGRALIADRARVRLDAIHGRAPPLPAVLRVDHLEWLVRYRLDRAAAADGAPAPTGLCGDGNVDPAETCDDGNRRDDLNGCSDACQANAVCGDGVRMAPEACDDGNTTDDGNGCLADCTLDPCCTASASPGCSGAMAIRTCVTGVIASCGNTAWTAACVDAVETYGCGVCTWP